MADYLPPTLIDHSVERVDRLRVHVIHPCRERAVCAQLAAMLVRHDVVRIVGAGAVEPEAADGLPFERFAGDDPVRAVLLAMRLGEQRPMSDCLNRRRLPLGGVMRAVSSIASRSGRSEAMWTSGR